MSREPWIDPELLGYSVLVFAVLAGLALSLALLSHC
jgi:hypothetical protein